MRGERIPITPAVLTWAREYAGFSFDDLHKAFPDMEQWESGEALPTYPQLERLSEKLKIPVAVFFFPSPPRLPSIRNSFRTLPDAEFNAFPRLLLRKAKAFQISLSELSNGRNPAEQNILRRRRFHLDTDIPSMASQIRKDLGVSLQEQCSWRDEEEAFEEWRKAFERQGIAVFKDAFRDNDFSGFCLYEESFPIIYINNSVKTREIFTLFHELAHLLFHTSGIAPSSEKPGRKPREEVICNRFAAEFLLPARNLKEDLEAREPNKSTAEDLARRYKVSREVVFRRFLDQKLISREEYEAAAGEWKGQQKSGTGGNHYNTKFSYLGLNYVQLAFSNYYQERITASELADYLGIKERYLPKFEAYFEKRL